MTKLVLIALFLGALRVVSPPGPDASDQVRDAVLEAFNDRLPGSADRHEITVVRLVGTPSPLPSVRVVLPAQPLLPKGRIQVRLVTDPNGDAAGAALIEIARFDSVAVLPRPVVRGGAVGLEEVTYAWVETTRFSGTPLTSATLRAYGTQELLAARTLKSAHPLRIGDLTPPPAAEAGERIRMSFERTAFRLELSCTARDRGFTGDIIRLYAQDGDIMYRARLTGPGTAEWIETL